MLKRVKLFSALSVLALTFIFMFGTCAFAAQKPISKPSNLKPLNLSPSDYQVRTDSDGNTEIELNNPREYLERNNVQIPDDVKNVRVIIKKNSNLNSIESAPEEKSSSNKVVPNASG